MTDADLDNLYKLNISVSHAAALRGIYDAGYTMGAGGAASQVDTSQTVSVTTATADDPTILNP